jgi:hypothetical protein
VRREVMVEFRIYEDGDENSNTAMMYFLEAYNEHSGYDDPDTAFAA